MESNLRKELETGVEEKVTHIEAVVCDQGQYGFMVCGNCNYGLEDDVSYDACPKCDYRFDGIKMDYGFGGSDF